MPESTEESSPTGFGANQWLVDEMRERFEQDPESVDRVWWDFFDRSGSGASDHSDPDHADAVEHAPVPHATASHGGGQRIVESTGAPKRRPAEASTDASPKQSGSTQQSPEKEQAQPLSEQKSSASTRSSSEGTEKPRGAAQKPTKSAAASTSSGSRTTGKADADTSAEAAV